MAEVIYEVIISESVLMKFVLVKDVESTTHFILQCSLFLKERQVHVNKIRDIDSSLIDQNKSPLCYALLFGNKNMNDSENAHIFNARIEYILSRERFNVTLFE